MLDTTLFAIKVRFTYMPGHSEYRPGWYDYATFGLFYDPNEAKNYAADTLSRLNKSEKYKLFSVDIVPVTILSRKITGSKIDVLHHGFLAVTVN